MPLWMRTRQRVPESGFAWTDSIIDSASGFRAFSVSRSRKALGVRRARITSISALRAKTSLRARADQ